MIWTPAQRGFHELLADRLLPFDPPYQVQSDWHEGLGDHGSQLVIRVTRPAADSVIGAEVQADGDVTVFVQPQDWPISGRAKRTEHLYVRPRYVDDGVAPWDDDQRELAATSITFLVEFLQS